METVFTKEEYALRRERVRAKMIEEGLEALFVSDVANRYYLSGFEMGDIHTYSCGGYLLLQKNGRDILFTDGRFAQAAANVWDSTAIVLYTDTSKDINTYLKKHVVGTVGIEENSMNLAFYKTFSKGLSIQKADTIVSSVRIIKEEKEVQIIKESVALNHAVMQWVELELQEGITERELAWKIEQYYKNHHSSHLSFSSIVAFGKHSALPHYAPEEGNAILHKEMPVLIDCGSVLNAYCSDQTRCFWYGNSPSKEFSQTYLYVEEAQRKSIEAIRAGVSAHDIFMVAWEYFESKGVAEYFTHGLGHGVGVAVHEEPRLRRGAETILQENMIVTVEPGLYYPEWGGIRLEYMVRVLQDGCEIL